jgi:hypothetical protein
VPIVLTVDQRGSRRGADRVDDILDALKPIPSTRPFERTAGDEIQAVFDDAEPASQAILQLLRDGHWSVGVGVGPVHLPLPASTRAGRGPAFELARVAVDAAKRSAQHVAVRAADTERGHDLDALLGLLAVVTRGRTRQAWEAIDLVESGLSQAEVAAKLSISPQAVSQRLAAAHWREERAGRPTLVRLLSRADGGSDELAGRSSGVAFA